MANITLRDALKEQLKDPEFRKEYEKEKIINAIAAMVFTLREEKKLTQAELAERSNTTQPVIARLEKGSDTRIPSIELLARIAHGAGKELNISFDNHQ